MTQLRDIPRTVWSRRFSIKRRVKSLAKRANSIRRRMRPKPPVCQSVKGWAATQPRSEYTTLFPSRQILRTLPMTVEPQISDVFVIREVADQREKYLVRIEGATLLGENGLVVLPDGSYVIDSIYNRSLLEEDPNYRLHRRQPVVMKGGNYFSLLVIWSKTGNYYHWLHDTLQRLYRAIELLPADTTYIVPAGLTPLQYETLRLVGINEHQLAVFAADEAWQVETLYFTPPTTNSGSDRREATEWLRDTILGAYQIRPESGGGQRLFVSRRSARSRGIVNEDAVEACLREYGFETIVPETLSFRQQVEAFARARVVVGPHGAGLTNMMFVPSGLVVVDLIQRSRMSASYSYWSMAEQLAHEYWYITTEERPQVSKKIGAYVPIEKLVATLDQIQLH